MSEGFRVAGFRPVYALDLDPNAIASYRQNVAQVAELHDVRKITSQVTADVLIAGPPCQGFSTLGRQDPKDERNLLSLTIPMWAQAADAKVVVVENVPKFLCSPVAQRLVRALENQGFATEGYVLEATRFGVAQRRDRGFIIGTKVGPCGAPTRTSNNPLPAGREILKRPFTPNDPMHWWPTPSLLALERFKATPPKGDKRDLLASRSDLCPPSWKRMGCQATDVWGRIDPERPANTLRCTFQNPSKGRYVHPFENRVLSLREGARLQGIPNRWVFRGKPYSIARQIGNGVPVPMAKAVALQVFDSLSGHSTS